MKRILIVRLGSMGDIIHALPVLASLRAAWPEADIDWLVDRRHVALMDLVTGLSNRHVIDTRRFGGSTGWLPVMRQLRRRHFDTVIDAQGLIKSALLARAAGAPAVIGFTRDHVRESAAAFLYTSRVGPRNAVHVVDKNLLLADAAGAPSLLKEFPLRVPEPRPEILSVLKTIGSPFAVLNPGGAWPNKRWLPGRFGAVAAHLLRSHGLRSLVLWGGDERPVAEIVAATSDGAASLGPATTVPDLVSILARARLVVSGDTGPIHIAAAVGTPVVGIYGPTNPARNGPWSPEDVTVSRNDRCQCFHARRCRIATWCLDDLGVAEVNDAVSARLAARTRSGAAR